MYHIQYNANLKEFARSLRNNSTLGEIILWKSLKAGSIMNYTFNRQKPLGRYIVDFYCKQLSLVIEVDGAYHYEEEQRMKDEEREAVLKSLGLSFLRVHDEEIRKDLDLVIKRIESFIKEYELKQLSV